MTHRNFLKPFSYSSLLLCRFSKLLYLSLPIINIMQFLPLTMITEIIIVIAKYYHTEYDTLLIASVKTKLRMGVN